MNQVQNKKRHQAAHAWVPWKYEKVLPKWREQVLTGADVPEDGFMLGVGLEGQYENEKNKIK